MAIRDDFEREAWQLHEQRAIAKGEPIGTPDELFWKQDDGSYGVLMFNAAWWGWQTALKAQNDRTQQMA